MELKLFRAFVDPTPSVREVGSNGRHAVEQIEGVPPDAVSPASPIKPGCVGRKVL